LKNIRQRRSQISAVPFDPLRPDAREQAFAGNADALADWAAQCAVRCGSNLSD
jgi:hypothetical protein